jgi:serine/threonine protein kinase
MVAGAAAPRPDGRVDHDGALPHLGQVHDRGPLPESLAGYRVVALLGEGSFSRVYHVVREGGRGFTRELALKVLSPAHAVTPDLRSMFEAEARIAAGLHHRNVVSVHEYGLADGRPWIAMDLVTGLDLRRLLRRLRARQAWMPVPAAVETAVQVLDGLHHAHTRRSEGGEPLVVVHRDLNPGNLLVDEGGCVRIADFGLAKLSAAGDTEAGITRGTARFMSPEQARGAGLDGRSDLFSVGTVLYVLLTGRLPFTGATDRDIMRSVVRAQFRPVQLGRPQVPDAVARVVHRLMAPSPASRYPTARDAAEALAEAYDRQGADRSTQALAELVRRASEEVEEATGEFDGPGTALPDASFGG